MVLPGVGDHEHVHAGVDGLHDRDVDGRSRRGVLKTDPRLERSDRRNVIRELGRRQTAIGVEVRNHSGVLARREAHAR